MKIVLLLVPVLTISWSVVLADAPGAGQTETTSGWVKHTRNPVLGGDLGTCFDVSVLKEDGKYRMWFSWRPK
jgi:beta-1,2-mannobiose phosphorylase / 1,2-beta-oligomannan phosphorylase